MSLCEFCPIPALELEAVTEAAQTPDVNVRTVACMAREITRFHAASLNVVNKMPSNQQKSIELCCNEIPEEFKAAIGSRVDSESQRFPAEVRNSLSRLAWLEFDPIDPADLA